MRETEVETKVCDHARDHGWGVEKVNTRNDKGRPDRRFSQSGRYFYIEFKAPGQPLRKLQQHRINMMIENGDAVYVVDNVQGGRRIIDAETRRLVVCDVVT